LPFGPLSFVQGSTNNEVEVQVPVPPGGITGFEGLTVTFNYDGNVFAPIELIQIPTSNDPYFDFVNSSVGEPQAGCTACSVTLSLLGSDLTFPAGATIPGPSILYHAKVRFDILPAAPLGLTTVTAEFDAENILSGTLPVQATIVPVPEPAAWATMVAGLLLLGVGAVRRRRRDD
jgi:MYXO-CTERM domain-containing protein